MSVLDVLTAPANNIHEIIALRLHLLPDPDQLEEARQILAPQRLP